MEQFKDIKECFNVILEGDKVASKKASRKAHKIISMMKRPDRFVLPGTEKLNEALEGL